MAIIKSRQITVLERVWRKGNTPTLLLGMQVGAATVGNSMEFPLKKKAKIKSLYDPMILLLGICPDKITV